MESFSIWKVFLTVCWTILKSLWFVFVPFLVAFTYWIVMIIYNYIKFRYVEHIKPKESFVKKQRKTSLFKNVFVLFPRQIASDILNQDPNDFSEFGIRVVVGEQGSGKTMTAVYLMQEWKKEYPLLKIYTNMCYKYEDGSLVHWKQLIERNNGTRGVVNMLDEMKTWFSNKESKDVPLSVLNEICQQRKQKKCILGTVQVFSELAKPFRSQVKTIYVPITIMGSLTIVRKTKAEWYDEDKNRFKRYKGFFVFAHTKELRTAYDTFKKIEKYKEIEFEKPSSDLFACGVESPPRVEIHTDKKNKKGRKIVL